MTLKTLARGQTHRQAVLLESLSLSRGDESVAGAGERPQLRGERGHLFDVGVAMGSVLGRVFGTRCGRRCPLVLGTRRLLLRVH
jgi:hypothetical protein